MGKVEGVEFLVVGGGDLLGVVGGKVFLGVIDLFDVGVYLGVVVVGIFVGLFELLFLLIMFVMWLL